MKFLFSSNAWDDYVYWQQNNKQVMKRINTLIKEIQRNPLEGIGKPEALQHGLAGYYSRRINGEHRIVYTVQEDCLLIAQLRYHYN